MIKKKKVPRTASALSSLDDLLKQEGKFEKFEVVAIKDVLTWQSQKR